ncbi:MAG: hypothetical protein ABI175_13400, partial [Polyangiales bacterium]
GGRAQILWTGKTGSPTVALDTRPRRHHRRWMMAVQKIGRVLKRGVELVRPKKPFALTKVGEPCRDRARTWVHSYAAGGAAFAFVPLPVPGSTTAGLVALEATMVHAIARIYGVDMPAKDIAALVAGLEVAGGALKIVAREACVLVPGVGWLFRAGIAAASIEAIGHSVISMFERRHPGRLTNDAVTVSTSMATTSPTSSVLDPSRT